MAAIAPPIHRGMTVLNRDAFVKSFQTLGVRVPVKKVGEFMKVFSTHLLNLPRLRNTVSDPESKDVRIVLLQKDLKEEDLANLEPSKAEKVKAESLGIVQHTIELDYNYWTAEQILHAVMPEDAVDIPSSYTQIGHIAHMNLRDECLPWKTLIGQVILDKNKNITTVVNKTNNIDTTFRFFKMEILAGQDNMIAEVKESNCRFKFDFSKVYWNSRLHTEHDRLVQQFEKNSRVCDVFAGVGPFALPAAKKGAIVYANDLNPESYRWLNENKTINKISDNLHTYNMDGREFIRQAVKDLQATGSDSEWKTFNHFVMNLPATAIEFLDAFRGLYRDQKSVFESTPHAKLPMIHCHCFTKSPNPADDIAERIQQVMGAPIDRTQSTFHWVRNVAPKKDMYCVSFPLSAEIAFASNVEKRKREAGEDIASANVDKNPKLEE